MDRLAAVSLALALLALGCALLPRARSGWARTWLAQMLSRRRTELEHARIQADPRAYLAMQLLAPPLLFVLGWAVSPVCAGLGGLAGLLVPWGYVAWRSSKQGRQAELEAPRLIQIILASLSAGSTYLDALREAGLAIRDPWVREDLQQVMQRFLLNVPLEAALREVRPRVRSRNLGLVWDTLVVCAGNHLPARTAWVLLSELATTVHTNVQMERELHARAAGQRLQIWLLAIIVPGMYLYLRLLSPELLSFLDETALGRYVFVPLAAALEVLGLYLSFRVSRSLR